jgi:hypothetical protein
MTTFVSECNVVNNQEINHANSNSYDSFEVLIECLLIVI